MSLVGGAIVGFSEWRGTLTEIKSGLAWFRKRLFQFPIWHLDGAVIEFLLAPDGTQRGMQPRGVHFDLGIVIDPEQPECRIY